MLINAAHGLDLAMYDNSGWHQCNTIDESILIFIIFFIKIL